MTDWRELESKYFMRTFKRLPMVIVRGRGVKVWDTEGKEYLDFLGGLAVNNLGHCHPVISRALAKQARTLIQTSNLIYTVPQLQLAELLVKNSCFEQVFIANSGAEANEGAVKLARKYGKLKLNGAYEVITALNSFHGRTLAMVAATGQPKFQKPYTPMPDGFLSVAYNDIEAVKRATTDKTCAIMLEPVQGEGGVNVPDQDYLAKVRDWCDRNNLLLMLDEVQTGMGRTGSLFAYSQFNVEPDVMTLAKGMASGVPIAALLARGKACVFEPGDHGSTFGGNPLACAAAYEVVKYVIDKRLWENAARTGAYLRERLMRLKKKYPFVIDVRGMGLLCALEFNSDLAEKVVMRSLQRGLIINNVKPNTIRFIPPLITTTRHVSQAMAILDDVLANIAK